MLGGTHTGPRLVRKNSKEKLLRGGVRWWLRKTCSRKLLLSLFILVCITAGSVVVTMTLLGKESDFSSFSKVRSDHLAVLHDDHKLQLNKDSNLRSSSVNSEIWEWSALTSGIQYRRGLQNGVPVWEELDTGKLKFRFEETSVSKDVVVLHDASRGMYIRLDDLEAGYLNGNYEPGKSSFTLFETGMWTVVKGVHVEIKDDGQKPPKPQHEESDHPTTTILVMLAAYRDPLCGNTLMEAFKFAKYPDRIRAAVVEQNDVSDGLSCLEGYCELVPDCRRSQVKVMTIDLDHSRGVMPGRYHQHELIGDEQFCLQADAHSAFEDDWDMIALEDWFSIQNEMAVITAYPNRVRDRHRQTLTPTRCDTKFDSRNEIVHGGNAAHNVRPAKVPQLITFFGAGTAFNKCHANLNVPYDPYMGFIFGGEEYNRAARLWTWGYDMYAPKRNFVYHYYDSEEKPPQAHGPRKRDFVSADKFNGEIAKESVARWRAILGLPKPNRIKKLSVAAMESAPLFGLGTRRKLSDFFKFSGVDFKEMKLETRCNMIGRNKWHPYLHNENFNPQCYKSSGSTQCCTTFDLIKESAADMLKLTNQEYNDLLTASPEYTGSDTPIISPLAMGKAMCPPST